MAVGSRPKAEGVTFFDANGRKLTALLKNDARSEIIISAGTIGSPQLLLLSGIGPSTSLQKQGIKVVLDQAMVGKDVADNPSNGLVIPSPRPVEISLVINVGITDFGSYIESLSGFNFLGGSARQDQNSAGLNQVLLSLSFSHFFSFVALDITRLRIYCSYSISRFETYYT